MNLFHYDMDDLENFNLDGEVYDIASFIHGNCHYIALEFAKETDANIILWFDFDEDYNIDVLCHAFNKTKDNTYFDARGYTFDVDDIINGFDYYSLHFEEYSYSDVVTILEELNIPFDDEDTSERARKIVKFHLDNAL